MVCEALRESAFQDLLREPWERTRTIEVAAFPKPVELGVRVPTVFAGDGVGLFVMCLGISRKESPVEDLSEESQLAGG